MQFMNAPILYMKVAAGFILMDNNLRRIFLAEMNPVSVIVGENSKNVVVAKSGF